MNFENLPEYIPLFETSTKVNADPNSTWEKSEDELDENEEELNEAYFSDEFSYRFENHLNVTKKVIWNLIFHGLS